MRVKIAICGGPIQALSSDMDTLYVGIKEGFNRQWDPDVLVERAKERTLSISLKKTEINIYESVCMVLSHTRRASGRMG